MQVLQEQEALHHDLLDEADKAPIKKAQHLQNALCPEDAVKVPDWGGKNTAFIKNVSSINNILTARSICGETSECTNMAMLVHSPPLTGDPMVIGS